MWEKKKTKEASNQSIIKYTGKINMKVIYLLKVLLVRENYNILQQSA